MMNMQDQKKQALQAYKMARAAWMETATDENIKGDFEKWKIFCDAKRYCMKLGVII